MNPLYIKDGVKHYRCACCGAIFIEMRQLEEHIKSSNTDLLNNVNCNIGFMRIVREVGGMIQPKGDYSDDELTMEVFERTKSIFHHCVKVVENKIETIDRENGSCQKKIHLESPIKLYCHQCPKELGTRVEAYIHQSKKHGIEDFSTEEMKEIIVYDATNYGDEIELEDIGVYIIGQSENFLTQLGKYIFQDRQSFRKFLNDENLKSNFVVEVKLKV